MSKRDRARTLILVITVASAFGAVAPSRAAASDCHPQAAALRESLEAVTEAVIENEEAILLIATEHLQRWWLEHRNAFGAGAEADRQIAGIAAAAQAGEATKAAAAAIGLSTTSLDWCGGGQRTDDQLMRLDLVGMTAWLRARGENLAFMPHAYGTAEQVAEKLDARGKHSLAKQTREAAKAALAVPVSTHGDVKAANRLLELVDKIERALR